MPNDLEEIAAKDPRTRARFGWVVDDIAVRKELQSQSDVTKAPMLEESCSEAVIGGARGAQRYNVTKVHDTNVSNLLLFLEKLECMEKVQVSDLLFDKRV